MANAIKERGSKEFERFLSILGNKIRLKGWDKYRGGLDVKGRSQYQLQPPLYKISLYIHIYINKKKNIKPLMKTETRAKKTPQATSSHGRYPGNSAHYHEIK